MSRPERFDHYQYHVHEPGSGRKRRKVPIIPILVIVALALGAGVGLYHFRLPLQTAAAGVATELRQAVATHFAAGFDTDAIVPFLKDVFTDEDPPAPSSREDSAAGPDAPAAFLYSVELTDGGRIEGNGISVGRQTVTITDDAGVTIRVDRARVARISKLPR